jgi:hypothetical protein
VDGPCRESRARPFFAAVRNDHDDEALFTKGRFLTRSSSPQGGGRTMQDKQSVPDEAPSVGLGYLSFAGGFWTGSDTRRAWLLTAAVTVFVLCQIATQIGMNVWNRVFFDALERKDAVAVGSADRPPLSGPDGMLVH